MTIGIRAVDKEPLSAVDYLFGMTTVDGQRVGPRPLSIANAAQALLSSTSFMSLRSRIANLEEGLTEVEAIAASRMDRQIEVAVAATTNITLSGEQTLDTTVTTSASTVLVPAQIDESQNGVYVTGAGPWTRHPDADSVAELVGLAVYVAGGTKWGQTTWMCTADAASTTYPFIVLGAGARPSKMLGGTKNLFNYLAVVEGSEVYPTGEIFDEADSAISEMIYVGAHATLTIRGLQSGSTAGPWGRWLAADKTTVVDTVNLLAAMTAPLVILRPASARWFQFSPRQRNPNAPSYGIQLEYGTFATAAENYTERVVAIDGIPTPIPVSPAVAIAGDSIAQTATVDMYGSYTPGPRNNWPNYAMAELGIEDWYNYATAGASFREYDGQDDMQKISNQISRLYADGRQANIFILAAGTNDYATGLPDLGNYATAMSKTTRETLDRSKTLEAARWAMWTINIHWPNARRLCMLPIQRADIEPTLMQPLADGLSAIARRYGFEVADGAAEAGIVKDFEVWDPDGTIGPGRDLSDGLHPYGPGHVKISGMVVPYIRRWVALT
ncbi:MAG: hypothetical protein J0I98_11310 [Mesorhizobium sp.]|nr:SGNH/GDSL hydrolase family protein [Mesorhizobium sp.]MBN9243372.1 hypothetical protein [Mesorhizobium sp.]